MISGRTSTSQSSAFQYAPTTTINEKVYTERRLRMTSRRVTATLRQQLRQAARGDTQSTPNGSPPRRLWKCFPLTAQHVNVPTKRHPDDTGNERNTSAHPRWLRTPSEFHQTLCDRIERARRRVHLASLYIGPAVDPFKYDKEATFAQVLSRIDPRVDVRILLDQHRALRPVPVPPAPHRSSATISSAEACRRALAQRPKLPDESHNGTADTEHNKSQIHLLSVLGPWLSRLPNPYNEIAGVFHVKLYVVDDAVLLSGANLSQEYFADRHDRYVCIYNGGNGLVDTYVDLIQALSEFGSQRYEGIDENGVAQLTNVPDRQRLFRAIRDVLTIEADTAGIDHEPDPDVIAYAVPTFQAPPGYFTATCDATELATMPTDLQTIHDLLRQTAAWAPAAASSSSSSLSAPQTTATTATTTHQSRPVTLRLASAYLNPTRSFLESTRNLNVFFLTAGKLSHGFRPKKVTGHVSKTAWIPTVFATLVASYPPWVKTWWYQRESWTFHAKGLWLTTTAEKVPESTTTTSKTNVPTLTKSQLRIPETDELLVVSHGSGNYGYRSEQRDMESNLLLVFPSPTDGQESNNPWAQQHIDEWNEFVPSAVPACLEDTDPLPKPVQWVLPYIKSFF